MHDEAMAFVLRARNRTVERHAKARVVEFGARNVNGSARTLFAWAAQYVGVDRTAGSGVDVACDARVFADCGFDVAVTTETLEHDPNPADIIEAAHRALRVGGVLIVTAAAPPRQPHRCDGTVGDLDGEHYRNVTVNDLIAWLADGWRDVVVEWDAVRGDVYAVAVKR